MIVSTVIPPAQQASNTKTVVIAGTLIAAAITIFIIANNLKPSKK
jgi:hypothetical protein